MRHNKPIMLIEDKSVDALAVKRALSELKVTNPLVHSINGQVALEYLRDKANKKPCIILLDLDMPEMNGIEFLKVIKADDILKKIPIVVLTLSEKEQDVVESFNLGVAGYMAKTIDYKKLVETVRTINLYWSLSESPNDL